MDLEIGTPFAGRKRDELRAFLHAMGLDYDEGVEFTVLARDGAGGIAAAGSLQRNVLKCIAVSPDRQGEGLTGTILTELKKRAFENGERHLFLYTKPLNERMFREMGFYPVAKTGTSLLMESERDGARRFAQALERPSRTGEAGAIVANCNPFTNGHLYLAETAASACAAVHLFILSEDRSAFPAAVRLELARRGVAHLPNVYVHPTGDYMVSSATFPTYFIKDKTTVDDVRCALDLTIFAEVFARELGITRRFVGTEPLSPVTCEYNRQMKAFLPARGIAVTEVERRAQDGEPVSASRVRALLARGELEPLRALVPPTTLRYLLERGAGDPPPDAVTG